MFEIFAIIFDRRHVKDVRMWVILMLAIGFGVYHKFVIVPMKERQDRQGKKIHAIVAVQHLQERIDKFLKDKGDK